MLQQLLLVLLVAFAAVSYAQSDGESTNGTSSSTMDNGKTRAPLLWIMTQTQAPPCG